MIIRVELHRFKRFTLNNIETFVYTPKAKLQLIQGTNGVGKSSLINELTPLPADLNNDYLDGGHKSITIYNHHKVYLLVSGVNGSKKHSFKIDNVEHNDGGTKKVQLLLVKEHFGVTPVIHDVLTGNNSFTKMSMLERKDWFSLISANDYNYALNIFKHITIESRDLNGGIKLLNSRLVTLEKDMLNPELELELTDKKLVLENMVSDILKNYTSVPTVPNNVAILTRLIKQINKFNNIQNIQKCETVIQRNDINIVNIKMTIEKLEHELVNLNSKKPISYIEEKMKVLEELNVKLKSMTPSPFVLPVQDIYTFMDNKGTIDRLLLDLDDNVKIEDRSSLKLIYKDLIISKDTLNNKLSVVSSKVEEYENIAKNDYTVCPKCTYKWIDKYDKVKHSELLRVRRKTGIELEKMLGNMSVVEQQLLIMDEQVKYREQLGLLLDNHVGRVIEELVKSRNVTLSMMLNLIVVEISNWSIMEDTKEDILKLEHEINLSKQLSMDNLNENILKVTTELKVNVEEYYSMKKLNQSLGEDLIYLNKIKKHRELIISNLHLYKQFITNNETIELNKIKENMVIDIKKEITRITLQVNENNIVNGKVKELEQQISEYQAKHEELKKILTAISPKEGLIAINIASTLGGVVNHMNSFISKIWSYNLNISAPKLDDDNDLVYRFPVTVNKNTTKDVYNTSTGMREIIDLSFKLTSIDKLGLSSTPLFLDEFGTALTETHRESAYNNLSQIMNSFEQVFMISHFSSIYGRFNNVDVIDLSLDGSEIYQIERS